MKKNFVLSLLVTVLLMIVTGIISAQVATKNCIIDPLYTGGCSSLHVESGFPFKFIGYQNNQALPFNWIFSLPNFLINFAIYFALSSGIVFLFKKRFAK